MTAHFKPGDVAMIPFSAGEERAMWVNDRWVVTGGRRPSAQYIDARPLVVIDPEEPEQVERLHRTYVDSCLDYGDAPPTNDLDPLIDALREFASPTPPKPHEPTGLGSVVEDAAGARWTRVDHDSLPWFCAERGGEWRGFHKLDAVRILSEGVAQ